MTPGVMIVWTDFPAESEDAFNEWYNRDHLVSRASCPGFRSGRRYIALTGAPKYVALYQTDSSAVFNSRPYLDLISGYAREDARYLPRFYNTTRCLCDVSASQSLGEGGLAAFLAFDWEAEREVAGRAHVAQAILPGLLARRGVVGAHLFETNRAVEAKAVTGFSVGTQRPWGGVIAVEGTTEADIEAARRGLLGIDGLRRAGIQSRLNYGVYRMLYRYPNPG